MKSSHLFYLFIFLFAGLSLRAQDTIRLGNSKDIVNIKIVDVTANTIKFQKFGQEKSRIKKIYPDRVFSIMYADGHEQVIYNPEPNDGEFSIEQMRLFIKGTRDARLHYHNVPSYLIGFIFGVGGPMGVASTGVFPSFLLLPPAIGIFICGLSSPNISKQKAIDRKYLNNEEYAMGFERKARLKKMRNAFIGSLFGIGAGFILANNVGFR